MIITEGHCDLKWRSRLTTFSYSKGYWPVNIIPFNSQYLWFTCYWGVEKLWQPKHNCIKSSSTNQNWLVKMQNLDLLVILDKNYSKNRNIQKKTFNLYNRALMMCWMKQKTSSTIYQSMRIKLKTLSVSLLDLPSHFG